MKKAILGLFLMGLLISSLGWSSQLEKGLTKNLNRVQQISLVSPNSAEAKKLPEKSSEPLPSSSSSTNNQTPKNQTPENHFSVDPERLWQNVEALAGERYHESDRLATQNYLTQQLKEFGFLTQLQPFDQGINLIAEQIPNQDPKQDHIDANRGTILVAAHYDTVLNSPGADDNASGLAVVLEVARLLGRQQTSLALKIAFFDQEEQGLLGSFAFTNQAENLERLQGVVVLDMVGYACHEIGCQRYPAGIDPTLLLQESGIENSGQGEFLAVIGELEHRSFLEPFRQAKSNDTLNLTLNSSIKLPPIVTLPVPLKGVLTPDVLRSDHAPFWYQQIPAVLVTDTANLRSPHYHQPSDTLETLDQGFLTGSAQLVVNAVAKLLQN
ncbi:MAG: M28 family peptidase [Microcoleaceae cyanobacterium]